jgi:endonuclease/exonuclease/phosphatase family metal-dependent hydrolase
LVSPFCINDSFEVGKIIVADDNMVKVASDHLPLIADFKMVE